MEAVGTTTLLTTTPVLKVKEREIPTLSDGEKSLLSPFGRRNKMRIEGHRGMGRYEPENTLQAFARSIDEQLDGIELDVWLTKDKFPVIIHSQAIDGVYGYIVFDDGSERQVCEMTLKEIRSQKILNGNIVPLLDEVFRLCKDKMCVNVEFKGTDLDGALEVMKLCKYYNNFEQVHFSSFNWKFAEALDQAREALNIESRQPFGFLTETMDIKEAFTIGKTGDGVTFGYHMIETDKENFKELAKEIMRNEFRPKVYFSFRQNEVNSVYDLLDSYEIDTVITNEPFLMKRYYSDKETVRVQ